MQSGTLLAYLVAFAASFFIMVIELVAGRILAPYIGQHLYSWTSIIGVCLAGISLGAVLGGWVADRFPRRSTIGWILFFAGILALLVPIVTDSVCNVDKSWINVSLMMRIVIYTSIIFLPVAVLLGMISPLVVKLMVQNLSSTGRTVGRIYAFSTLGSILGTFATGFFLVEEFGTRTLLYTVGAALIIIAPLAGGLFGRGTTGITAVILLAVAGVIGLSVAQPAAYADVRDRVKNAIGKPVRLNYDSNKGFEFTRPFDHYDYYNETSYFTLKVLRTEHQDRQTGDFRSIHDLILDNLIHSHSDPTDPTYLAYEYLRIYEELVGWQLDRKGTTQHRQLFIGGGGYTLQRYFHHLYKDCHIDVAEIDPGVTRVAEEFMYAPKNDPRLVTYNEDGRLFVLHNQKSPVKYEFIFGDAFNDLSIPFHLTTKEFNQQLRNMLTPDGLLMSLVIDHVGLGQFLPSFLATMRASFGDDNVVLIVIESLENRKDLIKYIEDQLKEGAQPVLARLEKEKLEAVSDAIREAVNATLKTRAEVDTYLRENKEDKKLQGLEGKPAEELTRLAREHKYAETMKELSKPRHKLDEDAPYLKSLELDYVAHSTVIVVASPNKQDWSHFEKYLDDLNRKFESNGSEKRTVSHVVRPGEITKYINTRTRPARLWDRLRSSNERVPWNPVVLTDDYAPVDNLTAPMFELRYGYKKKRSGGDED